MNKTSNANKLCAHCKRRSKKKQLWFNLHRFWETKYFFKKVTNYLELSKLCGRIGEKNFIIVGGMAIQEAVIDWGGGQQGPL